MLLLVRELAHKLLLLQVCLGLILRLRVGGVRVWVCVMTAQQRQQSCSHWTCMTMGSSSSDHGR